MTTSIQRLAAIALASLAAVGSLTAAAEAGGQKQLKSHVGRHQNYVYRNRVVVVHEVNSCGYFYDMWQSTGRHIWKGRYYACVYGRGYGNGW